MNRAYLIAMKPHGSLLVWCEILGFASERWHGFDGAQLLMGPGIFEPVAMLVFGKNRG